MIDTISFIDINSRKQYNSYYDFNFLIKDFSIDEATIKEELINIPGSSEFLDFSRSLNGDVNYNQRNINIVLNKIRGSVFLEEYSKIQNALHGKEVKLIHSRDLGFFWKGTVNIGSFDPHKKVSELNLVCKVEPFKYEINSSNEEWLWDPFSFEDGIINETKELIVNGELEVIITGRRKNCIPTIYCSSEMQVEFNNTIYNLVAGNQEIYNIEIIEGENKLKFFGNGVVTIFYRGGSL